MSSSIVPSTSPFDVIKQTRDDGSEFWSARELMELFDYARWEIVMAGVDRARSAIINADGISAGDHHVQVGLHMVQVGSGVSRSVPDYLLTRYGAYMWAMNGDPRKMEIARAQQYFAVKTREAETTTARMPSFAESLRGWAEAVEAAEQATAQLAIAAPKVEAFDTYLSATGKYLVGEVAKMLAVPDMGPVKLHAFLRARGVLMTEGTRRNMPYQKHIDAGRFTVEGAVRRNATTGELIVREDGAPISARTTHVTPRGIEYVRSLLIQAGHRPAVLELTA